MKKSSNRLTENSKRARRYFHTPGTSGLPNPFSCQQFNQKMEEIQESEDSRRDWLKQYVAAQLAFHEKSASLLKSLSSELDSQVIKRLFTRKASYKCIIKGGRSRVPSKRDDFSSGESPYGGSTSSYGSSAYGSGGYTAPTPPLPVYGTPPPELPTQR